MKVYLVLGLVSVISLEIFAISEYRFPLLLKKKINHEVIFHPGNWVKALLRGYSQHISFVTAACCNGSAVYADKIVFHLDASQILS